MKKSKSITPSHECSYKDTISDMKDDLNTIKTDVKSLLRFKWQIMGGAAILGFIITLVVQMGAFGVKFFNN